MSIQSLYELIEIDVRALIGVLFWGSLTSLALTGAYIRANKHKALHIGDFFLLAKLCLTLSYFLLFYRGTLPDLLSVNLGNSLLIIGFYFESLALCRIVGVTSRPVHAFTLSAVVLSLVSFNAVELINKDPGLRVAIASICVFIVLLIPSLVLIFSKGVTLFQRFIGVFYLFFISLLLPRAFYSFFRASVLLFTTTAIQSLTFISLVMLTLFSLSSYLLLMKEEDDKTITVMATTDFLTGLSNRYSFLERTELEFDRNKKAQYGTAVIFFDIDHFKKVNDTYGHAFGDIVLAKFSATLCQHMRNTDMICRYGGEEFLVFLSNTNEISAQLIAKRILQTARSNRFEEEPDFTYTVSAGLMCGVPAEEDSLQVWIDRADQALYHSKNTGRDKITDYSQLLAFLRSPEAVPPNEEIKNTQAQ